MSTTTTKARSVADLVEGTILATVTIAAPPERVFRALTSDEVLLWWGSDDTYRTTSFNCDPVEGGRWRAEGKGADGNPFAVEGKYLRIDAPRILVQTWVADWDGGAETIVTWRLDPTPDGTRVTLRHEGFAGRAESCQGHADGWAMVLGWLEQHTTPQANGAEAKFFLCRLIPPRPSFPFDMNEQEAAIMGEHVAYWAGHLKAGRAIVFGPVADPAGPWGLGVVRAADEAAVRRMEADDPAIRSGRGFRYEILPMLDAVVGG